MTDHKKDYNDLPRRVVDFIDSVIKKVRYRKKVRMEVRDELVDHFAMALSECNTAEEKETAAKEMIEEFGDIKTLSRLIRRGKKRCRPLWKKIIIRTFQVFCILFLFTAARAMYFEIGSPNISVDYTKWLNDLVRQGRDEELNARPYYDKAVELSQDIPESLKGVMDKTVSIEEVDRDELKKFLDGMKPAFDALRQGAAKPYYWPEYSVESEINKPMRFPAQIVERQLKYLSASKRLAMSMCFFQISWNAHNGNVKEALKDCVVLRRFGSHYTGKGLLIEQMVGVAVEKMAIASIETILYENDVDLDILKWLQKELEKDFGRGTSVYDLVAEKAFWLDCIQWGFTDDGNGNGRVLREGLPLVIKDGKAALSGFFLGTYPDRRKVTESIESVFDEFDTIFSMAPWELAGEEEEILESPVFADTGMLLKVLLPAFLKVRSMGWRYVCERKALVAIFGILRYQREEGRLAVSLGELVAGGFLNELPVDPFTGNPLIYRVDGDDFILYSVGTDLKDDGGVVGTDKRGRWGENGDAVFWPVR